MRTKKERSWTRKVGDASVGLASAAEQEGTIVEFRRLLSPQSQPHGVLAQWPPQTLDTSSGYTGTLLEQSLLHGTARSKVKCAPLYCSEPTQFSRALRRKPSFNSIRREQALRRPVVPAWGQPSVHWTVNLGRVG